MTPSSSHGIPLSQVKALIIDSFHSHIRKVIGLQSFFMFYGPTGIVSAACTTSITIQREVRESSDRAHFSESNVFNIHMPDPSSIGNLLITIKENSNAGLTHHVCFVFIREMMVISAPGSDPCYDILSWKTSSFQTSCTTGKNAQSIFRHPA